VADAGWSRKDLLGIAGLSAAEIGLVLDTAESFREVAARPIKKVPTLRGRTVINLFLEPSTRTRASFEIAEKRMSADAINLSASGLSLEKGESLSDTARTLEAMAPDILVVRHAHAGVPQWLAARLRTAVVNAGDGSHEHPTQALLDALTIRQHKRRVAGLKVAIVGDIEHSRVVRSNVLLLRALGAEVVIAGPLTLMPRQAAALGARVAYRLEEALDGADVVMMLRLQKERMDGALIPSMREYYHRFGLDADKLAAARPDAIVMHPGPMNRGVEIDGTLADDINVSVIQEQVEMGVAVRMAAMDLLARNLRARNAPGAVPC
jgi:aspartate carbamoyltransferase catalytic subunit